MPPVRAGRSSLTCTIGEGLPRGRWGGAPLPVPLGRAPSWLPGRSSLARTAEEELPRAASPAPPGGFWGLTRGHLPAPRRRTKIKDGETNDKAEQVKPGNCGFMFLRRKCESFPIRFSPLYPLWKRFCQFSQEIEMFSCNQMGQRLA